MGICFQLRDTYTTLTHSFPESPKLILRPDGCREFNYNFYDLTLMSFP